MAYTIRDDIFWKDVISKKGNDCDADLSSQQDLSCRILSNVAKANNFSSYSFQLTNPSADGQLQ